MFLLNFLLDVGYLSYSRLSVVPRVFESWKVSGRAQVFQLVWQERENIMAFDLKDYGGCLADTLREKRQFQL